MLDKLWDYDLLRKIYGSNADEHACFICILPDLFNASALVQMMFVIHPHSVKFFSCSGGWCTWVDTKKYAEICGQFA